MFTRLGVALATLAAAGAVAAPSALATTTDACFDPPLAASCSASTVEHGVDFAVVNMGRHSFGWYTLVCARGDDVAYRTHRVPVDGRVLLSTDGLFGLHNPACFLSAAAIADSVFTAARVRVTLVD